MTRPVAELMAVLKELSMNDALLAENIVQQMQEGSNYRWKANHPIAIIHAKSRMKEEKARLLFEDKRLFDEHSLTKTEWKNTQLDSIQELTPEYLQTVSIMCMDKRDEKPLQFRAKREGDYWKKLQDVAHIEAMVEISLFKEEDDVCQVEHALREIIRKRKEVSALKGTALIWIAVTKADQDIESVLTHYFHDAHHSMDIDGLKCHIAWSETLKAISMRHFVCPPK